MSLSFVTNVYRNRAMGLFCDSTMTYSRFPPMTHKSLDFRVLPSTHKSYNDSFSSLIMTHESKGGSHDQTHHQSTHDSIPRISYQRVAKDKASQSGARGTVSLKLLAHIVGSRVLYRRPQKGNWLGLVSMESPVYWEAHNRVATCPGGLITHYRYGGLGWFSLSPT